MNPTVVCSFWVHRPLDFPGCADFPRMLRILDASCRAAGMHHVVLTDLDTLETGPRIDGLDTFATELPRNLLQATTRAQANWMVSERSEGIDTVFVGADCIVRRDFRPSLLPADLSICTFPHPKLWIMNGFVHVPAASRAKVAPIFAEVARGTRALPAKTCDDMMSWERALKPKPRDLWGKEQRRGLTVRFLPEPIWNERPLSADEPYPDAHVLHFRGMPQKEMLFEWAARHRPELLPP